jgi:hypothetical protein
MWRLECVVCATGGGGRMTGGATALVVSTVGLNVVVPQSVLFSM